jgi:hypothetical protein
LAGSASTPAGAGSEGLTYIWSVDGEAVEVGPDAEILPDLGTFTIALTVYDEEGNYGEDSVTVTVSPVPGANRVFLPVISK